MTETLQREAVHNLPVNAFIGDQEIRAYGEGIEQKENRMSIGQLYLPPGEGEAVSLRGTELAFKATGKREADGPTVIEFIAAPGFSTGDHVHSKVEEIFYVVDGEFKLRCGEWSSLAGPGTFLRVPPGMAHGFGNPGSAPATLLLTISPAGVHEEYFRELAAILATPGPPDTAAIGDLRQRYDTVQVSPLTAT